MTESIYLCLFIWSVYYFAEFVRALKKAPAEAWVRPFEDSHAVQPV